MAQQPIFHFLLFSGQRQFRAAARTCRLREGAPVASHGLVPCAPAFRGEIADEALVLCEKGGAFSAGEIVRQ